jgi:type I restriction enzyme, S subunit
MIDGLKPYSATKATGVPWLATVPAHWDIRRNGRLFRARRETGYPDLPILEVSIGSGVRLRDLESGGRKQQMADRSKYQRAAQGDIAYNMMRMWQGAVGVVPVDGLVSPAYVVARPFPEADSRYFAYLFRTADYKHEVENYSRGIVPDRNRLYWESFKLISSPAPPTEEQRRIVRFLDAHGALTARLIRAKQRVIKLLEEQKEANIHRAVTRGLDPRVRLKPSGIAWLGDVSEDWEVRRLRNVADLRVSNVDKKSSDGELPVRLCNYVDVYKNDEIDDGIDFMHASASASEVKRFRIRVDDVVITKDSEECKDIGVPAYVSIEAPDLICGYHLALLRPISEVIRGRFLYWQLLGGAARWQLSVAANGVTRYGLSRGAIKELTLVLPPLATQLRLASYLDDATYDIRAAQRELRREIALIQELRSRLIADVVTGKFDVWAAAATLPEATERPEPFDEPEQTADEPIEDADEPDLEEVAA